MKIDGVDTVGLEYVNSNRCYGQSINRNSNLTIVNLYPSIQPFFGHFTMAIADILQANYISNEFFSKVSLLENNQVNLAENKNYFENSKLHPALCEIKKDIASLKKEDGIFIFMVNAGNNEYLMQFNIGSEKGDNSFENGLYFSDKEKLEEYYNNAKVIADKYEKLIAKHATVGRPEKNHIVNYIRTETQNDVLMLHVNVSILKQSEVDYYHCISDFATIFRND